jgi:hypothetical protein
LGSDPSCSLTSHFQVEPWGLTPSTRQAPHSHANSNPGVIPGLGPRGQPSGAHSCVDRWDQVSSVFDGPKCGCSPPLPTPQTYPAREETSSPSRARRVDAGCYASTILRHPGRFAKEVENAGFAAVQGGGALHARVVLLLEKPHHCHGGRRK